MSLKAQQVSLLTKALANYNFPAWVWDGKLVEVDGIGQVEEFIAKHLRGSRFSEIQKGLVSVVSWGWGRSSLLVSRTRNTVGAIGEIHVERFIDCREKYPSGNIREFARARIPQLGQMAFASKVLAFIHPKTRAVFDKKINEVVREACLGKELPGLRGSTFSVTHGAASQYDEWCRSCGRGAILMGEKFRAVDFERAIFQLTASGDHMAAAECLRAV